MGKKQKVVVTEHGDWKKKHISVNEDIRREATKTLLYETVFG